jgi:hypothetical protein
MLLSLALYSTKMGPETRRTNSRNKANKKTSKFPQTFSNQVKTFLLFKRRQTRSFKTAIFFKGVGGRAYTAGSEAKIRRRRFTRRRRVARRRRRQRCAPICLTDRNEGDHEAEDEKDGGGA